MRITVIDQAARAIGRVALASLFLLGAVNKVALWDETLARMEGVGLSPAVILLPMTVSLELLGGLAIAYGRRPWVRIGFVLGVYTLATNLFFHRFWELDGALRSLELSLFFKNVAIAGGLVAIAGYAIPKEK